MDEEDIRTYEITYHCTYKVKVTHEAYDIEGYAYDMAGMHGDVHREDWTYEIREVEDDT